jgi:hypothetical protein
MLAGIGPSKNGRLKGAQWQPLEFMRRRGKTIRPRQRHHQQKETHADRDALLPSGGDAARMNQLSTIHNRLSTLRLLNHFLKLCAEHVNASIGIKIATERDVKPIPFLAFDNKFVGLSDAGRARRILSGLRDHVDK